jgi:hypothetical protein
MIAAMRYLVLILQPALFAASVTISTDFEGGALQRIEMVSNAHFRLAVKGDKDQDGRNRQANWYYFQVDHARTKSPLTLDIVDLPGEYNYQPNRGAITKDTPPVISYDRRHWTHVKEFEYDPKEPKLTLRITPEKARFWIAHVPPYTSQELGRLRGSAVKHPDFHEQIIGKTVGGRNLVLWTIASGVEDKSKHTVWLMFRQHSWESGSSWVGEGAVRALLANENLRKTITWKILPFCDPDGVARGGVRFNSHGYDLNRNWDVVDAQKMPEITAQRNAVKTWLAEGHKISLFLSLHNTETGEYLEGPPADHRPLAERFFETLSKQTSFAPTTPLRFAAETTTAGKAGRMTVVQGLYRDFQIPAFLMEQRISMNPKLGHLPVVKDRIAFGAELVKAIHETVSGSDHRH